MIKVLIFDPKTSNLIEGGEELLAGWQASTDKLVWVDICNESLDKEQALMCATLGLHKLAVQDAQRDRHPPKLEVFPSALFLLFKELAAQARDVEFVTSQLAVFVSERFLVTRHSGASRSVDALYAWVKQDASPVQKGIGALVMYLTRKLVDRYVQLLLELEPRIEKLEDEMMTHPDDSMLVELLNYKSELKKFRRVFIYHEHIFRELKNKDIAFVGERYEHEIIDVYEHQERAGSLASLYYELASDLVEGYISVASHRLNQIMKVLTVVMSIFVPLSFLAGIYGMNFENMPELRSRSGYFILLSIMGAIVFTLLFVFHKKRWLK